MSFKGTIYARSIKCRNMLNQFSTYIKKNRLFEVDDKLLVAVSGGVDSVCLLNMLIQCGYNVAVAHCNFQLRGAESDGDEAFVKQLADEKKLVFYSKRFNTQEYANEYGISIQMAARQLRYNWFDTIRKANNYSFTIIAHNRNDVSETFFINLLRGTGIKGLAGIPMKNENIVRPLLFASRIQIVEYVHFYNIQYREDSSNTQTKYLRNKIRHELMPLLNEINEHSLDNIYHTIQHLNDAALIYAETIDQYRQTFVQINGDEVYIEIEKIKNTQTPETILYELIHQYGFTSKQCADIFENINGISGQVFLSNTHKMVHDRVQLIVIPIDNIVSEKYYIENIEKAIHEPIKLVFKLYTPDEYTIPKQKTIASVDYDLLEFPLILRKWQNGDYFQPLGMSGFKKLSDFFVDSKLSIVEKEKTWIVESAGKIVWVVGHRIDNRFKITENTQKILSIE